MLHIASGTYEGNLAGWNLTCRGDYVQAELVYAFNAHDESVRTVALSDAAVPTLATGSADESIGVFDLRRQKQVGTLHEHRSAWRTGIDSLKIGGISALEFVGSSHLLSGSEDGVLCIWRCHDWNAEHVVSAHKGRVSGLACHPSRRAALSVGSDRAVALWDLAKGRKSFSFPLPAEGRAVRYSPSASGFLVVTDGAVLVYSAEDGKLIRQCGSESRVHAAAFLDERWVVGGCEDGNMRLWDASSSEGGRGMVVETGHSMRIRGLAVVDAKALFDADSRIDARSIPPASAPARVSPLGRQEHRRFEVDAPSRADGRIVVTADSDGIVKLWSAARLLDVEQEGRRGDEEGGGEEEDEEEEEEGGIPGAVVEPLSTLEGARGVRITCLAAAMVRGEKDKAAGGRAKGKGVKRARATEEGKGGGGGGEEEPVKKRKSVAFGGTTTISEVLERNEGKTKRRKKQKKGKTEIGRA